MPGPTGIGRDGMKPGLEPLRKAVANVEDQELFFICASGVRSDLEMMSFNDGL